MTQGKWAMILLITAILGFPSSSAASAQEKRHGLEVRAAWISGAGGTEVTSSTQSGITSSFDAPSLAGTFSYCYRTTRGLAVIVAVSANEAKLTLVCDSVTDEAA